MQEKILRTEKKKNTLVIESGSGIPNIELCLPLSNLLIFAIMNSSHFLLKAFNFLAIYRLWTCIHLI